MINGSIACRACSDGLYLKDADTRQGGQSPSSSRRDHHIVLVASRLAYRREPTNGLLAFLFSGHPPTSLIPRWSSSRVPIQSTCSWRYKSLLIGNPQAYRN